MDANEVFYYVVLGTIFGVCIFSIQVLIITFRAWYSERKNEKKLNKKNRTTIAVVEVSCPKFGQDGISSVIDNFAVEKKPFRTHVFRCMRCGYESNIYRTNLPPERYISAKS